MPGQKPAPSSIQRLKAPMDSEQLFFNQILAQSRLQKESVFATSE
jgi:hypothetical protein